MKNLWGAGDVWGLEPGDDLVVVYINVRLGGATH